jgi:hypothetical protein
LSKMLLMCLLTAFSVEDLLVAMTGVVAPGWRARRPGPPRRCGPSRQGGRQGRRGSPRGAVGLAEAERGQRFTAHPRIIWTVIAGLVGLLSLAGPLSTIASTTAANGVSLARE